MTAITASNQIFKLQQIQQSLTIKAKTVYLYLAHRANKLNTCFPGLKLIAKECGISLSSAQRAMKELLNIGLLKKEARYRENRSQTSNLYILAGSGADMDAFRELNDTIAKLQEEEKQQQQMSLLQVDQSADSAQEEICNDEQEAIVACEKTNVDTAEKSGQNQENICLLSAPEPVLCLPLPNLTSPPSQIDTPNNLKKLTNLQERKKELLQALYLKWEDNVCRPLNQSWNCLIKPAKPLPKVETAGKGIWIALRSFTNIHFRNRS